MLAVDRFGNVALNLTRDAPRRGLDRARACGSSSRPAATGTTPSRRAPSPTRPPGELILYEDSYRNVAVAVTRGSAASLLGVEEGSELVIAVDAI